MGEIIPNKILVVEDDAMVRGYLATVLTDEGYSVTVRSSGKAAKELLKKEAFDLVLTDLIMPEFTGLDLLKFIRKNRLNSEVIILTAFSDMDSVLGALREGADDFLIKPIDRLVLHKAITRSFDKIELERAKKNVDEKYHRLFESTTDMVFILDSKGIVSEMNSRGLEIFGRTRGQIVGKHYKRLIQKEDFDEAAQAFTRAEEGKISKFTARIRPKDNSLWYFEFNCSPFYEEGKIQGVYCIAHDITELKKLQNRLEEYTHNLEKLVEERNSELKISEERLRALTSTAQDGVIIASSSGVITYANPAAGRIFGCPSASLENQPLENFFVLESKESQKNPLKPFLKQGGDTLPAGKTVEASAKRKTGEIFPVEISISSFAVKEESYVTIIIRDITERAEMHGRILKRQKMESIGRLAGGIAHNLNNILCGILGYATFLKSASDKGSDLFRYLEIIEDSCNKASDLVRHIVEYAEGGKYQVEIHNPAELINGAVDFLKQTFPKNIVIESKIDPNVKNIECDISQMRQVLLNLSINAQEAMPNGGTLTLTAANFKPDAQVLKKHADIGSGNYVAISVKDTGKGIDQKAMEQIFEPFNTTKGFGYGLGLASSFGIVKRHNGVIDVESSKGKGATFTILLPATDKKISRQPETRMSRIRKGSETILVIDDEKLFIELAKDVLIKSGYKVYTARNGKDGVGEFEKHKNTIDLVLLDFILPDLEGEEVIKAIRAMNPKTRIAITSGYNIQNIRGDIRPFINGAFLKKPCTAEDMTEVVRMALDNES